MHYARSWHSAYFLPVCSALFTLNVWQAVTFNTVRWRCNGRTCSWSVTLNSTLTLTLHPPRYACTHTRTDERTCWRHNQMPRFSLNGPALDGNKSEAIMFGTRPRLRAFPQCHRCCFSAELSGMGPSCVTRSNQTRQMTDPTQPNTSGKICTRPSTINNGAYRLVVTYFYTQNLSRTFSQPSINLFMFFADNLLSRGP